MGVLTLTCRWWRRKRTRFLLGPYSVGGRTTGAWYRRVANCERAAYRWLSTGYERAAVCTIPQTKRWEAVPLVLHWSAVQFVGANLWCEAHAGKRQTMTEIEEARVDEATFVGSQHAKSDRKRQDRDGVTPDTLSAEDTRWTSCE